MSTSNTPPPPAHTAGRLTINEHGRVITESGQPFRANGVAQTAANFASDNLREAEANARRLVALWNACEALPTEALERGAVERLVGALNFWDAPAPEEEDELREWVDRNHRLTRSTLALADAGRAALATQPETPRPADTPDPEAWAALLRATREYGSEPGWFRVEQSSLGEWKVVIFTAGASLSARGNSADLNTAIRAAIAQAEGREDRQ